MNWNRYARLYGTLLTEHLAAFMMFLVSGFYFTVALLQGLVAGEFHAGLLALFAIPGYCLYIMWRGVRDSEREIGA